MTIRAKIGKFKVLEVTVQKVFADAVLLKSCASKQAPYMQPDADGAKKEQKQEEEARGGCSYF
jgi:hypothetical protein